ncbi:MAG: hypothetical protein HEP71_25945 [Roseivirga sp.]|nr:hypothetical protein [Roseivirga sp.]
MPKKYSLALMVLLFLNACSPSNRPEVLNRTFDDLIDHLDSVSSWNGDISPPDIYLSDRFNIHLTTDSPVFEKQKLRIKNPTGPEPYPVSYSVIYKQHIISLFESGKFSCIDINTFQRNRSFENRLNQLDSEYLWLLDGKLVAKSGLGHYVFNENDKWEPYDRYIPKAPQKILFEDSSFLISCDCYGEFGGTIYFYQKATQETYLTDAMCARSIVLEDGAYKVLSSLGHGVGFSDLRLIPDPRKLTRLSDLDPFDLSPYQKQHLGFLDSTNYGESKFDFYSIQLFALFNHNRQHLYLTRWRGVTFITEIQGNTISVSDPLFADNLYVHNPISTDYGNGLVLINLDFWGLGKDREVGMILINGDKLTHIEWYNSKNPAHRKPKTGE